MRHDLIQRARELQPYLAEALQRVQQELEGPPPGTEQGTSKETPTARKTVLVSDLSGTEIPDGKGAQVTIKFNDARKGTIVLDVTDAVAALRS